MASISESQLKLVGENTTANASMLGIWLAQFEQWTQPTEHERDVAMVTLFGGQDGFDTWLNKGARLMEEASLGGHLGQWISRGHIDAGSLVTQFNQRDLTVVSYDDEGYESRRNRLGTVWERAVGRAIFFDNAPYPGTLPQQRAFLEGTLHCLFQDTEMRSVRTRAENEQLARLCQEHIWAREVMALRAIQVWSDGHNWAWVFDDILLDNPSKELIGEIIHVLDMTDGNVRTNTIEQNMAAFRLQAPAFLAAVEEAHRTYMALCGPVPTTYPERMDFSETRVRVVQDMLGQQKIAVLVDSNTMSDVLGLES